jgi:hypothetical protein
MAREIYGNSETVYVNQKPNWQCSAYGCKLPGGASHGFGPEAKYYCRFHYGKEPQQNDFITKILHHYNEIFEGVYAIKEVSDLQKMQLYFERLGRSDLAPVPQEALLPHYYRDRLIKVLGQEITDEIKKQKEARQAA